MKNEWNKHFTNYIRDLDSKKPVIWTGDLNVAPTELGKYDDIPIYRVYSRSMRIRITCASTYATLDVNAKTIALAPLMNRPCKC